MSTEVEGQLLGFPETEDTVPGSELQVLFLLSQVLSGMRGQDTLPFPCATKKSPVRVCPALPQCTLALRLSQVGRVGRPYWGQNLMVNPREMITSKADSQIQAYLAAE